MLVNYTRDKRAREELSPSKIFHKIGPFLGISKETLMFSLLRDAGTHPDSVP